jgi:hypothetical protein
MDELIAKLRRKRAVLHDTITLYRTLELVNPDGPEAADALTTLQVREATLIRERDALAAENDRLSKAVCSGVLGELLSDDETEALAGFVKMLRSEALATSDLAEGKNHA